MTTVTLQTLRDRHGVFVNVGDLIKWLNKSIAIAPETEAAKALDALVRTLGELA